MLTVAERQKRIVISSLKKELEALFSAQSQKAITGVEGESPIISITEVAQEMATVLVENLYGGGIAQQTIDANHSHDYLPLTGGTVTGTIRATKIIPATLVIPKTIPVIGEGECGLFINATGFGGEEPEGGSGKNSFWELDDVDVALKTHGQVPMYNGESSKWESMFISKAMITDFAHTHPREDITGLGLGDYHPYEGSELVDLTAKRLSSKILVIPNIAPSEVEAGCALFTSDTGFSGSEPSSPDIANFGDLEDVTFGTLGANQTAVYDSTLGYFTNKTVSLNGHSHNDLYYTKSQVNALIDNIEPTGDFHPLYGLLEGTPLDFNAAKLKMTTLVLPTISPSLVSGEWALYMADTGFSGAEPPSPTISFLEDLEDVTFGALGNNQAAVYDSSLGYFTNQTVSLDGHNHNSIYYTKTEVNALIGSEDYHPLYGLDGGTTPLDFNAAKLIMETLVLPTTAPTLSSGEGGLYISDTGFGGETPASPTINTLSDIPDTSLTSAIEGDIIIRDGLGRWINIPFAHNHNSTYYTKIEIDSAGYLTSLPSHNHNTLYYTKTEVNALVGSGDYHPLYGLDGGTTPLDFNADKLIMSTLVLPTTTTPSLTTGEWGLYIGDTGFGGETPASPIINTLSDIPDTSLSTATTGDIIIRDSSGQWIATPFTHDHSSLYYTKSEVTALVGGVSVDAYTTNEIDDFFAGNGAITGYSKTNWDTAYSQRHTHSNKSVLDGITTTKINAWDGVVTDFDGHDHDDLYYTKTQVDSLVGSVTIDAYTTSEIDDFFSGATLISGYNRVNWNTAYGWGNHASQGYLTSLPPHNHDDRHLLLPKSLFNSSLGVLIRTDIASYEDVAVEVVVRGSKGASDNLLNTDINFYHTSTNISGLRAIGHGSLGYVYVFVFDGVVHIWFPSPPTYSNLRVQVFTSGGNRQDRTIYVTNEAIPSNGKTKTKSILPSTIYTELNSNRSDVAWNASSFVEGGTVLSSKYLGINANAASATKLSNIRTIWGQSFDGTANITGALTSVTTINASGIITMAENINTNLRVPESAPSNPTSNKWYIYIS